MSSFLIKHSLIKWVLHVCKPVSCPGLSTCWICRLSIPIAEPSIALDLQNQVPEPGLNSEKPLVGERISELLRQSLITCSPLKCVERGEVPPSTAFCPLQVKPLSASGQMLFCSHFPALATYITGTAAAAGPLQKGSDHPCPNIAGCFSGLAAEERRKEVI